MLTQTTAEHYYIIHSIRKRDVGSARTDAIEARYRTEAFSTAGSIRNPRSRYSIIEPRAVEAPSSPPSKFDGFEQTTSMLYEALNLLRKSPDKCDLPGVAPVQLAATRAAEEREARLERVRQAQFDRIAHMQENEIREARLEEIEQARAEEVRAKAAKAEAHIRLKQEAVIRELAAEQEAKTARVAFAASVIASAKADAATDCCNAADVAARAAYDAAHAAVQSMHEAIEAESEARFRVESARERILTRRAAEDALEAAAGAAEAAHAVAELGRMCAHDVTREVSAVVDEALWVARCAEASAAEGTYCFPCLFSSSISFRTLLSLTSLPPPSPLPPSPSLAISLSISLCLSVSHTFD